MRGRRPSRTLELPEPNQYVQMLLGEYSSWAFDEERAPKLRGVWRSEVFRMPETQPLDLEIGTGNGFHFAHYAKTHPDRSFLGIEIKYKPLIQSIRRAVTAGSTNARILRYNASLLTEIFAPQELNDVMIHFPDPWPRKKQWKHRLIQTEFLDLLFELQKPGSRVEFKTDNRDYFEWTMERAKKSRYKISEESWDYHREPHAQGAFITHFESIFMKQGLPTHRTVWVKE